VVNLILPIDSSSDAESKIVFKNYYQGPFKLKIRISGQSLPLNPQKFQFSKLTQIKNIFSSLQGQ
jgi:hypothetical protein